jgi:hypothetical protein
MISDAPDAITLELAEVVELLAIGPTWKADDYTLRLVFFYWVVEAAVALIPVTFLPFWLLGTNCGYYAF